MKKSSRIFVAGCDGLIGAAILKSLKSRGFLKLFSDNELNVTLNRQSEVERFFSKTQPEYVFCAAGNTGGIGANQKYPADLMLDNLQKTTNVITAAHACKAKKLIYIASSCSYPRMCSQPMKEDFLFSGPLEPTNQAYAMAKLAGIQLCLSFNDQYSDAFIPVIPTNYFGPGDKFDPENSHVIEALIRRMHEAKNNGLTQVSIWGSGKATREFLCVDDIADAVIFVMKNYTGAAPINVGGGAILSIRELAETIRDIVGYTGSLRFDSTKPDGMPEKCLDSSILFSLGWRPTVGFGQALSATYDWFLKNRMSLN